MNSSLVYIIIPILTGFTAFLAHEAMAVFHDGIRPILPELVEGRMKRNEVAGVAFGLSVGFIASVGISFTLSTGLLNPWLLFLPTDIIGVASPKKWLAALFGALWGLAVVTSLGTVNMVLTSLPVDMIAALGQLSNPVVTFFALFPVLAILYQFGKTKGFIAAVVVLLTRVLVGKFTTIYPESIELFVGVVLLIIFAVIESKNVDKVEGEENVFSERTDRIKKNVIFLAIGGALIAVAANMQMFAGSEISINLLAEAYKTGNANLIQQAAIGDFMRGLGFVPLIATTALTTGVYGVAGLTFIYPVGYLAPNPIFAAIGGAAVVFVEVMLLAQIGKFLGRFPTIRAASDNIRTAITATMEFALLIGAIMSCNEMGGGTGLAIGALIYFINEGLGKPVMKLAIGPVIAIGTGIILNLLYFVGLF